MKNKKLKFYKLGVKEKVVLLISSFFISMSYISAPILARSIIDAFIYLEDNNGLIYSIAVLASVELLSIIVNINYNARLIYLYETFVLTAKNYLINQFLVRKDRKKHDEFLDIWNKRIYQYGFYNFNVKWRKYKDVMVVIVMTIIACSMGFHAGLFVAGLILLSLTLAYFQKMYSSYNYKVAKSYETKEKTYIENAIKHDYTFQYLGEPKQISKKFFNITYLLERGRINNLKSRNAFDNVIRFFRSFSIVGVILLSVYFQRTGEWSLGTIWALLIVCYRIIGPIQSVTQWIFSQNPEGYFVEGITNFHASRYLKDYEEKSEWVKVRKFLDDSIGKVSLWIAEESQFKNLVSTINYWESKVLENKKTICLSSLTNDTIDVVHKRYDTFFLINKNKSLDPKAVSKLVDKAKSINKKATFHLLNSNHTSLSKMDYVVSLNKKAKISVLEMKTQKKEIGEFLYNHWKTNTAYNERYSMEECFDKIFSEKKSPKVYLTKEKDKKFKKYLYIDHPLGGYIVLVNNKDKLEEKKIHVNSKEKVIKELFKVSVAA